MNTTADTILNLTKQRMQAASNVQLNIFGSVKRIYKRIMMGRIGLTVFLIVWAIVMSVLIARKPDGEKNIEDSINYKRKTINEAYDRDYDRYYTLHRIWFGDESVLMILFKIWFWVTVAWMVGPILRHFVLFMRVKEMFQ